MYHETRTMSRNYLRNPALRDTVPLLVYTQFKTASAYLRCGNVGNFARSSSSPVSATQSRRRASDPQCLCAKQLLRLFPPYISCALPRTITSLNCVAKLGGLDHTRGITEHVVETAYRIGSIYPPFFPDHCRSCCDAAAAAAATLVSDQLAPRAHEIASVSSSFRKSAKVRARSDRLVGNHFSCSYREIRPRSCAHPPYGGYAGDHMEYQKVRTLSVARIFRILRRGRPTFIPATR